MTNNEFGIYKNPLTEQEIKEHLYNNVRVLDNPIKYHLIDCLKQLKFGRPSSNQQILDKFIEELEQDLDKGKPFC
jgi:hypothetical protein